LILKRRRRGGREKQREASVGFQIKRKSERRKNRGRETPPTWVEENEEENLLEENEFLIVVHQL
jgi:hypothetical protein